MKPLFSKKLKTRRALAIHLARFGSANVYRVDGGRFELDWSPAIGNTNESGVLFLYGNPSVSIKETEKRVEAAIALHFGEQVGL